MPETIPLTKNWMQDIFTPSTMGEKWSMTMMWTEKRKAHTSTRRSPRLMPSASPGHAQQVEARQGEGHGQSHEGAAFLSEKQAQITGTMTI